jgi:hypothetical protein
MRENYSCGKVFYMGDVQGPQKVNDTCVKTMHAGTMDRDLTVLTEKPIPVTLWFQFQLYFGRTIFIN